VAVRRTHHGNFDALIAQSSDASGPFSLDRGPPFEFEAELAKEINRPSEVIDDDPYVVHPYERHVSNLQERSGLSTERCLKQSFVHGSSPCIYPAQWHTVYQTESRSATQGGTMKVPYAKKWQNETDSLRKIVLDCDLVEELKWGKPCFTYQKKNVAIVIPLKGACALFVLQRRLAKGPKAHSPEGRRGAGRPLD
jgi:Domain of unknown function (DU1801)